MIDDPGPFSVGGDDETSNMIEALLTRTASVAGEQLAGKPLGKNAQPLDSIIRRTSLSIATQVMIQVAIHNKNLPLSEAIDGICHGLGSTLGLLPESDAESAYGFIGEQLSLYELRIRTAMQPGAKLDG